MTPEQHTTELEKRAAALREKLSTPSLEALELARIERAIEQAKRPQSLQLTGTKESLLPELRQLEVKLGHERKVIAQQTDAVLGRSDPRWVKIHRQTLLDNAKLGDFAIKQRLAPLLARIENLRAQLAEIDRREQTTNEPHDAA